jgi:hypothetical protein
LFAAIAGIATAAAPPGAPDPANGAGGAARPAQWRTFDLLVRLQDLPRDYSCPDLWYKFRDVLLAIGARQFMLIEPYACAVKGGGPARAPSVHLKFQLPHPLKADEVRYADVSSLEKLVRLAPGHPGSLQPEDCVLVQQIQGALLESLPLRIAGSDFRCGASPAGYSVTLAAALAADTGSEEHAGAAQAAPRR